MVKLRNIKAKLLNSNAVEFEFLRSIVSSQAASWIDMLLSFGLFALLDITPWLATLCGAAAGGVTNCIINYKFTFHAGDCPWKAVAVKYVLVWAGSVVFNALGTELLYRLLAQVDWLASLGVSADGIFAAVRLFVSLVVSLAWNFLLQRNFVYRPSKFDPTAIAIVNMLIPSYHKK